MKREPGISGSMKRSVAMLVGAASFGAILGHPAVSEAFWARQHPSFCHQELGSAGAYSDGCNVTTGGSIVVSCPVIDTQANPKTSIAFMNVHVDDKSPSFIIASRCVSYYSATGGACGGIDTSVNGIDTLYPPTWGGWNATDFGAIYVTIPPASGGNKSCLKGYYTQG